MADETTQTNAVADTVAKAAAALKGSGTEATVAKAAPVKDEPETEVAKAETPEAEQSKEVAKAETPEDDEAFEKKVSKAVMAVLPGAVAAALAEALAPVTTELNEVRKSLGVVSENTAATLAFQDATTDILTGLKSDVAEQQAVAKSVAITVETIAEQPAGRKGALNNVTKAAAVAAPTLNLQPLRDWAATEGYSVAERVTLVHKAQQGQIDPSVPTEVRKAMGVNE